jgi:hypothetical protein
MAINSYSTNARSKNLALSHALLKSFFVIRR